MLGRADAGRVQAIGARAGVRLQSRDRLVDVGPPAPGSTPLAPPTGYRRPPDRWPCAPHASRDGIVQAVERLSSSPVESSMESPATPVSTASRTLSETPSGSRAWPLSKSALIGRSVASTIVRRCVRTASGLVPPSIAASAHAEPELVVASALNPRVCGWRALPASQVFEYDEAAVAMQLVKAAALIGSARSAGGHGVDLR